MSWIKTVTTSSVAEGPRGTMGADKTPRQMARKLLEVNAGKSRTSILRYMQFVINRAGGRMSPAHRGKIKQAMLIIKSGAE